jgi:adenylate kinase
MGAILRENHDWKFADGKTVGGIIDGGTFLSDDQLLDVVRGKMESIPREKGVIFDGIPRRIGQAKFLLEYLRQQERKGFVTIFLDVPEAESVRRLLRRAEIEGRADDTPDGIKHRLQQYQEVTVPMLDYLREQTVFLDVDGSPSIPEVERNVADALQIDQQK